MVSNVVGVDVIRQPDVMVEPIIYTGGRLPFEDRAFDLVYAIDAIHHLRSPAYHLNEIMRCSLRYVLLKDHVYRTTTQYTALCIMDKLFNLYRGIPCTYTFQAPSSGMISLRRQGLRCDA